MPNPLETMASKGMGKAKAARAAMKGLKGIFRTLTEEHGEASVLLKRIETTSDPAVRAELFPTVREALLAHERAELAILYPELQKHDVTRAIAQQHQREADELESLLSKLHVRPCDTPEWKTLFGRLVELVDHHTSTEEERFFPRAQQVLGAGTAEMLDEAYATQKETITRRLIADRTS